ncbi:uncharacterized protein LOC125545173 [Triticum urartu]|nr:uncharacterized protein LOC123062464 [Triticum aestivum]XP_044341930.1 uncharacterized protein LOC123062464 [Triticum aestivum]XP_048565005.1 uncharacterized protein LOC125545173 [Triticum urartu]XP_048565006.1 uncharacterized protein LOC125545173 [Triticum urartu]
MGHTVAEDDIEDIPSSDANSPILTEHHITVPTLHDGLMQGEHQHERRLLDFLKATPSVQWLKDINVCAPLGKIQLPSIGVHRYLHVHFIRTVDWSSLLAICKNHLKHPLNIALLIWLLCVAAAGAMLGLLLLGLLNKAFPSRALRHHWIEIDNQILNALFTLMSIYQHPILVHHLVLLCRWRPEDAAQLRKLYCKNGARRPNERAHMSFVVALLHVTCISQYMECSLYWGYPSRSRSEFAENFFFILGVSAPVVAGAHMVYSPLGRDDDDDAAASCEETKQLHLHAAAGAEESPEERTAVGNPMWAGELLDCGEDPAACYLSFLCTFCVFGWNMERLGLGNMYVHTAMFLLLCVAPFWVFNVTALSIHDYVLSDAFGAAGVVLCFLGLLYGGFWRIQMRKRLGLPRSRWCCGSSSLTDYAQWLLCWPCALAQEVRTANLYGLRDDGGFYGKLVDGGDPERGPDVPVSVGVREGIDAAVHLAVDGEMIPPVQPVVESGRQRQAGDEEIVANGSSVQLKS